MDTPTPLDLAKQLEIDAAALVAALTPAVPAPPPATVVPAGGNLQAVIDNAQPGDVIRVAAGATFPTLVLRKKAAGAAITIRPDVDDSQLPAAGVRASAANLPAMFTITPTPGSNLGVSTELGAGPYTIIGMHVTSPGSDGTMVAIGDQAFATLADVPHDITIDRCILDGGGACKRGISNHGANVSIINNMIFGVVKPGQDTQAIAGSRGPGPYLIENNYLSAGTETIIFGGDDPKIAGLIPSDIVIRGNYVTKDLAWRTVKGTVKNAIELKNAQRVLIEKNIFEFAWVDEQTGFLLMLTVRNQNGTAPWSTVRDVEIRQNVFRHGNQAISILGLDDIKDSAGVVHPSVRMQNVSIHDNLFYDVGGPQWGGGSGTRMVFVNNGPIGLTVQHDTFVGATGGFLAVVPGTSKALATNLQVIGNIFPEGSWGISGDGSVSMGAPSWFAGVDAASVFDFNAINPSGAKWKYPGANTRLAAMTFDGGFSAAPPLACADGKPAGADTAGLVAAIPGLDLSK